MVNYDTIQIDQTFFALSSNTRRDLLLQLQAGPTRLVDLATTLGLSLPALHKHVAVLEQALLISKKKIGRGRYVTVNLPALQTAEDWMREYTQLWNAQFDNVAAYIDELHSQGEI